MLINDFYDIYLWFSELNTSNEIVDFIKNTEQLQRDLSKNKLLWKIKINYVRNLAVIWRKPKSRIPLI